MTTQTQKARQRRKSNPDLTTLAHELEQHLSAIRQAIRKPIDAEVARGGLTGPQRQVMQVLVSTDGINLKELTARVGLAHSTVSGIVDRLERQGLAKRVVDPRDRRNSMIVSSEVVRNYMKNEFPRLMAQPLEQALSRGSRADIEVILAGMRRLRNLLVQ